MHFGNRTMKKNSIFMEEWWLDCVTEGKIEFINYTHSNKLNIKLPIYKIKNLGMTSISMPPYTRTLSPQFDIPESKPFKKGQNIRRLVEGLVQNIPNYSNFRLSFDPHDETLFAFELEGFNISNQSTFQYDFNVDLEDVWNNLDQKTRNLIRTTDKLLEIRIENSIDSFFYLSKKQRNEESTHNYKLLEEICRQCLLRDQLVTVVAYKGHIPVAASIVIWGENIMYFWQSARDTNFSYAGANSLLLWECMKLASSMGKILDFDCYGSVSSAKFLAGFGLYPISRPTVYKYTPCYGMMKEVKRLFTGWN